MKIRSAKNVGKVLSSRNNTSDTVWTSELGGPSGKLFRFVSCVRARGAYVRSDLGENPWSGTFPFPFLDREVFPFPSALQGPIQLQLALSVHDFYSGFVLCEFHLL